MRFIPAFYTESYPSETQALKSVSEMDCDWSRIPLAEGGELLVAGEFGAILVPHRDGGCELWLTSPELERATSEAAAEDIKEYEAVMGNRVWKIFTVTD